MKRLGVWLFAVILLVSSAEWTVAQAAAPASAPSDSGLRDGDFVAICGDSITEQKLYSADMEAYLLACQPAAQLRSQQFGWSGEWAKQFLARMDNDVDRFHPTVATTCYGMNDGAYKPLTPETIASYRANQSAVIDDLKTAGVRFIVLGSPGCVDSYTFHRATVKAADYNKTLSALRDADKQLATEKGVAFADVNAVMNAVMVKAKAKYGKEFPFAGHDGIHPLPAGHLVMAYAFLKALGCDGNIGTVTIDLAHKSASADQGHKVLSYADGIVELESTRYAFCVYGDPAESDPAAALASPQGTAALVDLFPFDDDLNRFRLVVTGGTGKYKVTWSEASPGGVRDGGAEPDPDAGGAEPQSASKEFSAEDLARGINLAAEFQTNPFSKPFQRVMKAVARQQAYETPMMKTVLTKIPSMLAVVPEEQASFDHIIGAMAAKDQSLATAATAAVAPVRHIIKVEPIN